MSGRNARTDLQRVYALLLGGLIASFIGLTVFSILQDPHFSGKSWVLLVAVLSGLVSATGLMVGGLFATDRLPWLGGALLWGSGFTMIWSIAISFGTEPRWIMPVALGVAIACGVAIGARRFGRADRPALGEAEGA